MNSRRNRSRRLGVEPLENKRLLAGDVFVSVSGDGTLLIRGDAESNGIAVTTGDSGGEVIVAGLPSVGGEATSINGAFERVSFSGVSNGIRADLGDGDDNARLFDMRLRGSVNIATGDGDDVVSVGGAAGSNGQMNSLFTGGLNISTGEGNDGVRVGSAGIFRGVSFATGDGDDIVTIDGSRLRGSSQIVTDGGADNVNVSRSLVSSIRMGTGAGDDRVNLASSSFVAVGVSTGDDSDQVVVEDVRAKAAFFNGGSDADRLVFNGQNRFGLITINKFESIGGDDDAERGNIDTIFAELDGSADSLSLAGSSQSALETKSPLAAT